MEYEEFNYNKENDIFFVSQKRTSGGNMPNHHFHSTYEVFFLVEGERYLFIKDRTVGLKAGDLIIIKPNILHMTTNALVPDYERIIINFQERFLFHKHFSFLDQLGLLFENDYIVINFHLHHRLFIQEMLNKIIVEAKQKHTGFELQIQAYTLQLLIFTCRFIEENQVEPLQYINPVHERISGVVRYINDNYYKELTLQYIADEFFISSYYLSRVFKEVTGFSFVHYLNSVRVKEAKKLLEDTDMKVYLIAKKTGFGSVTNFGRVFKEITGHTPLYYRHVNH